MTSCDHITPLLARVADGDAAPSESARVAGHLETCSCCAILLARERRLSEAIETMRDVEVGTDFCDSVMHLLPARFHKRKRDRRGLRLASIVGLFALATAFGSTLVAVYFLRTGLPKI